MVLYSKIQEIRNGLLINIYTVRIFLIPEELRLRLKKAQSSRSLPNAYMTKTRQTNCRLAQTPCVLFQPPEHGKVEPRVELMAEYGRAIIFGRENKTWGWVDIWLDVYLRAEMGTGVGQRRHCFFCITVLYLRESQ